MLQLFRFQNNKLPKNDDFIEIFDDYQDIIREASRYKITVSAYLRSCALMRIAGDLIEKKIADDEYVSKYSTMKTLDDRGTF